MSTDMGSKKNAENRNRNGKLFKKRWSPKKKQQEGQKETNRETKTSGTENRIEMDGIETDMEETGEMEMNGTETAGDNDTNGMEEAVQSDMEIVEVGEQSEMEISGQNEVERNEQSGVEEMDAYYGSRTECGGSGQTTSQGKNYRTLIGINPANILSPPQCQYSKHPDTNAVPTADKQQGLQGTRIINLQQLDGYIGELTSHVATCKLSQEAASKTGAAIIVEGEYVREGLASIIGARCSGCDKKISLSTSTRIQGM